MTYKVSEVVGFLDATLDIGAFRDYGPNGLQIEASTEVSTVVTGVSASMELFTSAAEQNADLVVVHHGLIWGGGLTRVCGVDAKRVGALFANQMSLAAYHLPLDKHSRLGNNAGLCDALGLGDERDGFGDVRGHALGVAACYPQPLSRDRFVERIGEGVLGGGHPRFVFPYGPEQVTRVGVCTGAASDLLTAAAEAGCDAFVTGELAERSGALAQELGITLVAAGHYATEVFGVRRLAEELSKHFDDLHAEYVEVSSPL